MANADSNVGWNFCESCNFRCNAASHIRPIRNIKHSERNIPNPAKREDLQAYSKSRPTSLVHSNIPSKTKSRSTSKTSLSPAPPPPPSSSASTASKVPETNIYRVTVFTGGCSTKPSVHVEAFISLFADTLQLTRYPLVERVSSLLVKNNSHATMQSLAPQKTRFEPNTRRKFFFKGPPIDRLKRVKLEHTSSQPGDAWFVEKLTIEDVTPAGASGGGEAGGSGGASGGGEAGGSGGAGDGTTNRRKKWVCACNKWLAVNCEDAKTQRVLVPIEQLPDLTLYQLETSVSRQSMKFAGEFEPTWQIYVKFHGATRMSDKFVLNLPDKSISAADVFRPGSREEFLVQMDENIGKLKGIRIGIERIRNSKSRNASKRRQDEQSLDSDDVFHDLLFDHVKLLVITKTQSVSPENSKSTKNTSDSNDAPEKYKHFEFPVRRWIGNGPKSSSDYVDVWCKKSEIERPENDSPKDQKASKSIPENEEISYDVTFCTGNKDFSGTDSTVYLQMMGAGNDKWSKIFSFSDDDKSRFEMNKQDAFRIKGPDIGPIQKIKVWHSNTGDFPGWYLKEVVVLRYFTAQDVCKELERLKTSRNIPRDLNRLILWKAKNSDKENTFSNNTSKAKARSSSTSSMSSSSSDEFSILKKKKQNEISRDNENRKLNNKNRNFSNKFERDSSSDSSSSSSIISNKESSPKKQHKSVTDTKSLTLAVPFGEKTHFPNESWLEADNSRDSKSSIKKVLKADQHNLSSIEFSNITINLPE